MIHFPKIFNMLKIDMHSHIIPKNLPDWEKKFGYEGFIRREHHKPSWANMMQIIQQLLMEQLL